MNRLYRCRHDRRLAGVAAGVAEYLGLDVTAVRVLWFLSIFFGGFSILLYIGLAIVMPLEPLSDADAALAAASDADGHRHASRGGGSGRLTTFFGLAIMLVGALALVDALVPSWTDAWRYLGPALFLGIGALLVWSAVRNRPDEPAEPKETPSAP